MKRAIFAFAVVAAMTGLAHADGKYPTAPNNSGPAGGSGTAANYGGTIYENVTSVSSVTTGEIDAQSFTLPANTLNANGQMIVCRSSFVHAANTNSASLKVYAFGAQLVFRAVSTSGTYSDVELILVRTSSSTVRYLVKWWADTINVTGGILSSLNFTTTNVIKNAVIGATTNGDMVAQILRCQWVP